MQIAMGCNKGGDDTFRRDFCICFLSLQKIPLGLGLISNTPALDVLVHILH